MAESNRPMHCIYVFSMLSLDRILISECVVIDLFMHSIPDMVLRTLLGSAFFYTKGVFA